MKCMKVLAAIAAVMSVWAGLAFADTGSLPLIITSESSRVDYRLLGPYEYKNLAVYMIRGKETVADKEILPLEEALKRGFVRVNETGQVNALSAENTSSNYYVLIQASDIVKGGRQDRTIGRDVLLPPNSGKVALQSFCVEQGRWTSRGNESVKHFASSGKKLSSKALKLAAKEAKSQDKVWQAVREEQEKLSQKTGKSVKSKVSATSLQLTLEDKDIQKQTLAYVSALSGIGGNASDVVGFAYAVNGEFSAADVYGNFLLFRGAWDKALEAAACEAMAAYDPAAGKRSAPSLQKISEEVRAAMEGRLKERKQNRETWNVTRDNGDQILFDTRDKEQRLIHMNVIKK